MNKETAFANHVLASIRKDLDFLKQHQYLTQQQYDEIKRNLPVNAPLAGGPTAANAARAVGGGGGSPGSAPSPNNEKVLSTAEALYPFDGPNPQDLSFNQGDIIRVHEKVNNDWWRGSCNGKTGLFPSNYVTEKQAAVHTPPPPPPPATNTSMPGTPTMQEKGAPPPSYGGAGGYPPAPSSYNNTPPPSYGAPPTAYPAYSSAPPPPQSQSYAAPPPQSQSYAAPPQVVQQQTYSAPPTQEAPTSSSSSSGHGSGMGGKLGGIATSVGSNVANAAQWGFGATLGSEAAHSLFN
ncbi:hypothetical protein BDB00DRAFT_821999 [Zychaea mexicana]|uniref:uncharacterized protein n=1 Tax=Zychaea mexicana TaxID=64656 RepID=UPI0022FDE719|nr:uncharacterized protein BDB00DRAFT_821999 [Zychaea mexicana]KAI9493655.1 hypothetical protein BDB00DRAFT_821999 [Zychaea mexicana]